MKRPKVKIKSKNIINDLLKYVEKLLPHIKRYEGLLGLTLNGGLSRGYADHLSEIDITLFLEPDVYKKWKNNNQSALQNANRIHDTIYELDGLLYDIKYLDFTEEQNKEWEQVALWDASYAEILYDPKNMIHQLYDSKLGKIPDINIAKNNLFACWWYYHLATNIWINREDIQQGHLMLTEAIKSLLNALYIVNNEYIPHEKWIVHMSRSLQCLPKNWNERVSLAMTANNKSIEDLKERLKVIEGLHLEVEDYFKNAYKPKPFPKMKNINNYLTRHFS